MLNAGHGAGLTVIVKFLSDVCAPPAAQLSVALTVNVGVPATVGVPLINPDVLMFNPDGNAPDTMLKVIGACPPDVAV
jgi:hypothetical protein